MKTKRKLIILEPECKSPSGHGLGSLEQYFNFFKDYNNVFCVTNNKLTKENFFNKKKIINSFTIYEEYFKIKKKIDFFFIVPRIFFFFKKVCDFIVFYN